MNALAPAKDFFFRGESSWVKQPFLRVAEVDDEGGNLLTVKPEPARLLIGIVAKRGVVATIAIVRLDAQLHWLRVRVYKLDQPAEVLRLLHDPHGRVQHQVCRQQ